MTKKQILPFLVAALFFGLKSIIRAQTPAPTFEIDAILQNNIGSPWAIAFINKDEMLYTERSGVLRRYNILTNTSTPITGVPAVAQVGQGGLLDVALHPNFTQNNFVYLTYAVAVTGGQTTALGRGTLVGNALQNFTVLFTALPIVNSGSHFGSRIAFDRNNFLYFSVGDRGTPTFAQDRNNHAGKVMRLNDDGTVPTDNPFVGVANTRPEIFSFGHRNIQGMAMNPANGLIYAHEHGPRGGDELNVIKRGANYGWPLVTFGIDYNGTIISPDTARPGLEPPLTYWVPSIAPSGMVFIQNNQAPNEADILIGALAGTHIHYVKLRNDKVIQSSRNIRDYARFRDVRQAPDGKLYALTETPNRLVRIRTSLTLGPIGQACLVPNLGNDVSICGVTGSITLNSRLTAANRTFSWERNRETIAGTGPTLSISTPGVYTVLVDSAGCKHQEDVIITATLPTPVLGNSRDLCSPANTQLDAGVTGTGFTYSWTRNALPTNITTRTFNATEAGTYAVTVSASSCPSTTSSIVVSSSLPTVTGDAICGAGIATLIATGTGPFNWYNSATSTTVLSTQSSYSPNVTATTTFFVQATPGASYTFGPANKGTGAWDINDYASNDKEIVIGALTNVLLDKLDVDPQNGAQSVTINVTDIVSNTIIRTVTQSIPANLSTIDVGANLIGGRSYRIDAIGTTGRLFFRNQATPVLWPQTIANIATVRANEPCWANSWTPFFNIVLSTGKACDRVPVVAAVNVCNNIEETVSNLEQIKIYPNPFENSFSINTNAFKNEIQRIELTNLEGKLIKSFERNSLTSDLTFGNDLKSGQYMIRIITNSKVIVKPVLKLK